MMWTCVFHGGKGQLLSRMSTHIRHVIPPHTTPFGQMARDARSIPVPGVEDFTQHCYPEVPHPVHNFVRPVQPELFIAATILEFRVAPSHSECGRQGANLASMKLIYYNYVETGRNFDWSQKFSVTLNSTIKGHLMTASSTKRSDDRQRKMRAIATTANVTAIADRRSKMKRLPTQNESARDDRQRKSQRSPTADMTASAK